jgi:putative hydrolase of the HAD superfamily
MYQNYIFDLYGTLIDIKTDESSESVWEKTAVFMGYQGTYISGKELKQSYDKYVKKYLSRVKNTDYPDIDITDVFYKIYKDLDTKASPKLVQHTVKAFRAITTEHIRLYPGVFEMLNELKKSKKRLFILSNAQRAFLQAEVKMLGIKNFFDEIYASSDKGLGKPDPAFFEMVLSENNLKKKETIMIGKDYATDIKGAIAIGMDSLYIHTNLSDKKAKREEATFEIADGFHEDIIKLLVLQQ